MVDGMADWWEKLKVVSLAGDLADMKAALKADCLVDKMVHQWGGPMVEKLVVETVVSWVDLWVG